MAVIKPISPSDVVKRLIPEPVIEAFNELISERYLDGIADVKLEDAVTRIKAKMPDVTSKEIFDRGWLNVEDAFRAAGWKVEYDKPGYNETYSAHYVFRGRPSPAGGDGNG